MPTLFCRVYPTPRQAGTSLSRSWASQIANAIPPVGVFEAKEVINVILVILLEYPVPCVIVGP